MKYQAKKGNPHPLEKYNKLTFRQENQEFLQKYLTNKKFDYVGLEQTSEANTSSTSKETEGWLSKNQIADFEKLPVDHPRLNDKLAGLAARAHSCKAWADKGEMEYFYTGAKMTEKGEQYVQSSKVKAKGAINKFLQESMIQGLSSSSSVPAQAIEDGPKPDGDEAAKQRKAGDDDDDDDDDDQEEATALQEAWALQKVALTKVTKQMGELANEALTVQGALTHKTHLAGLIEEVQKQMLIFEPQKNEALGMLGGMAMKSTDSQKKDKIKEAKTMVEKCKAHIQGFRMGAFKDARMLLTSG